jgi:GT2 family glycosyltransferase
MERMTADPLREVGVVIVTYRSSRTIARTLDTLPVARVAATVVVDNASDDDTVAVIERQARPGVTEAALVDNRGFGAGNNAGVARVGPCRWLLFLNPDAAIDAANLERLVAYLQAHPAVGLVGPRVLSHGTPVTPGGRLATLWTECRGLLPPPLARLLPDRRLPPDYARSGPVGYIEGGCMLVDAALFHEIGGFDERYFLFFEEMDLSQRMRGLGREVHLCADAWVDHDVGASRADIPYGGHPELLRSVIKYFDKWQGRRAARRYRRFGLACIWLAGVTRRVEPERLAARRRAFDDAWASLPDVGA